MARTLTLDSHKVDYSAGARFKVYATFTHYNTALAADTKREVTCDVTSEVTLTAPTGMK